MQPSPTGAALQAKVKEKLKEAFDAAGVGRQASLTREQAARAGWAMVVRDFDRIDATRSGRVSFETSAASCGRAAPHAGESVQCVASRTRGYAYSRPMTARA
jgi:hypothetical protein